MERNIMIKRRLPQHPSGVNTHDNFIPQIGDFGKARVIDRNEGAYLSTTDSEAEDRILFGGIPVCWWAVEVLHPESFGIRAQPGPPYVRFAILEQPGPSHALQPAPSEAPEEPNISGKYTLKADVWSFGVLLWEMFELGQRSPYSDAYPDGVDVRNLAQFKSRLETGDLRLARPDVVPVPEDLWEVIESCWTVNTNQRPSIQDIHARLKSVNEEHEIDG